MLITFVTLMLMTDQDRINKLIWVIVGSIGFYCVKGGVFTVLTGGVYRVYGPWGSFIEENNSLALATLMIIPLMMYLHKLTENKWIKYGLILSIIMSIMSVIGSQSRGALIGIIAVGIFFWFKSKSKLIAGITLIVIGSMSWNFMPEYWHERMASIINYEDDVSAMGRINAWKYAVNIANDRLTGGGLISWKPETFAIYAPVPEDIHAAHSIYFGPLADHGWPGLILFLLVLFLTWRNLTHVIKSTSDKYDLYQRDYLAKMLQVSLIAYMSAGAFLSLAYFDLPWHLIAIAVLLKNQTIVEKHKPDKGLKQVRRVS